MTFIVSFDFHKAFHLMEKAMAPAATTSTANFGNCVGSSAAEGRITIVIRISALAAKVFPLFVDPCAITQSIGAEELS